MQKLLKKLWDFGPALVICGSILWALDGVLRRSLFSLPPITIVFVEHLIGTLLLSPVFWQYRDVISRLKLRTWGLVGVIALLSGVLGTLWFTAALQAVQFIPFSVVYLVLQLEPIFAVGTAVVILKEKVNTQFLWWAGAALVATYFVIFPAGQINWATGSGTLLAALLALGATAAWGSSTTFSKLLLNQVPDRVATALRFGVTTLFAFAGVFILGASSSFDLISPGVATRLVVIAFSTGMVALYIYYRGLQRTEAKLTTFLELVFPCLAVFVDAVLYHTMLQPAQYLAGIVLLVIMTRLVKAAKVR